MTTVHSCGRSWLLSVGGGSAEALVSFGEPPVDVAAARRHCSHELAYASLVALEAAFQRCGHLGRARVAADLRGALPVRRG